MWTISPSRNWPSRTGAHRKCLGLVDAGRPSARLSWEKLSSASDPVALVEEVPGERRYLFLLGGGGAVKEANLTHHSVII